MKLVYALIYVVFLTSCTSVSITDRKQLMILGDDVIYPEAFKAYKDFKSKTKLIESGKELDEINKVTNKLKTAIKNYESNYSESIFIEYMKKVFEDERT